MASDTKVREACRMRMPLDGADAQALEGALQQLERENAELRARAEAAEAQLQAEREHIAHLRAEAQQAEREREAAEARIAEAMAECDVQIASRTDAAGRPAFRRIRRALAGEKGGG